MRLGRATVYAIFAVVHLARTSPQVSVPARDIAETYGIPPAHLMKLLQSLVRAGILNSGRGPNGGFCLKKQPEKISLLSIVEAIEGPLAGRITLEKGITAPGTAHGGLEHCYQQVVDYARTVLQNKSVATLTR